MRAKSGEAFEYGLLRRFGILFSGVFAATCVLADPYPGHPVTTPDINAADLSARDKAISDDAFQGRGPGTVAGEAASQWIADEMKRIGLRPGNHGSYFQPVPAVNITLAGGAIHPRIQHAARSARAEVPGRHGLLDTPL
jgi:hypothetical protein